MKRRLSLLIFGTPAALALLTLLPTPDTSVAAWIREVLRPCPQRRRRKQQRAERCLVIGHRGAAGYAPENTIPSMERALADGADALEIDLCMTADGRIILWHDRDPNYYKSLLRELGQEPYVLCRPRFPSIGSSYRRPIEELTYHEVVEHYGYVPISDNGEVCPPIATFDQFLAWAKGKSKLRHLFLDLKISAERPENVERMVRIIEECLGEFDLTCDVTYMTEEEGVHDVLSRILPDGNATLDVEPPPGVVLNPKRFSSVRRAIERGSRVASLISPYPSTLAPWTTLRRMLEHDLMLLRNHNGNGAERIVERVVVSTVNDEEQMACLIGVGAGGIITDYPDRLRRAVDRIG